MVCPQMHLAPSALVLGRGGPRAHLSSSCSRLDEEAGAKAHRAPGRVPRFQTRPVGAARWSGKGPLYTLGGAENDLFPSTTWPIDPLLLEF